jgi:hypothetical protein
MVIDLVNHLWKPEERCVFRYTHVPLQRAIVVVDQITFMATLDKDVMEGRKIMIVFRSKNDMLAWLAGQAGTREGLGLLPLTYIAISKDSTDEEMLIFQHIDTALADVQVFCFTSKLTSAADIQLLFYRVYVHGGNQSDWGPTAREVYQMIGRARNVHDPNVMVLLPSATENDTPSHADEMTHLMAMKDSRRQYVAAIGLSEIVPNADGNLQWSPNWFMILSAHDSVERKEDFCTAFARITLEKCYTFLDAAPFKCTDTTASLSMSKGMVETKDERNRRERRVLEALQLQSLAELNAESAQLEHNYDLTAEQREQKAQIFVLLRFPAYYREMDLESVKWVDTNYGSLVLARWLKEFRDVGRASVGPAILTQDLRRLSDGKMPETARVVGPAFEQIDIAVKLLGYLGLEDDETEIQKEVFGDNVIAARVMEACDRAAAFCNRRPGESKTAEGAIRRELACLGHTLERMRRGKSKCVYFKITILKKVAKLLPHFITSTQPVEATRSREHIFVGLENMRVGPTASNPLELIRPPPIVERKRGKRKAPATAPGPVWEQEAKAKDKSLRTKMWCKVGTLKSKNRTEAPHSVDSEVPSYARKAPAGTILDMQGWSKLCPDQN